MHEKANDLFNHVLDAVGTGWWDCDPVDQPRSSPCIVLSTTAFPLDPTPGPSIGAPEYWNRTLDWISEGDNRVNRLKSGDTSGGSLEAIVEELGLMAANSIGDLAKVRRLFMWNNHPDRRPDLPCDIANQRVAIVNTLIDRAIKVVLNNKKT